MAIDRTAYNALVDDDGTGVVGTPWTKNIVKTVLLDPIDAAIAAAGGVGTAAIGQVFASAGVGVAPLWTAMPAVTGIVCGTNPAQTGTIRLGNNQYMLQRNAANTADVVILGLNTTDRLVLGGTNIPVVPSGTGQDLGPASGGPMWRNGYFSGTVFGLNVAVGVNPAATGDLRLPNNGAGLVGRNAANTGDIPLLQINGSDRVVLGGTAPVDVTSVTVAAGTVASPSLALPGAYGFFGGSAFSRIGVSFGGVERMRFDATAADYGFAFASTSTLMWNSGAFAGGATTCDARLRRTAAGTLALDNGAGAGGVFLTGTAVGIGAIIAATGDVRGSSAFSVKARNAANAADITLLSLATDRVVLGDGTADTQWAKPLVAVGPTTLITLGKTGGSGPATAAQNSWLRLLDSTGAACWIPVWK